jgi:alkylation response protein AidB-like acyl-CoA dehydrogenase
VGIDVTDEQMLDGIIDHFLCRHPLGSGGLTAFLGAQFDAGLAWVHNPVGLGGLGLSASLQRRVDERIDVPTDMRPQIRNLIGVGMSAPTITAHGTAGQQARYLRRIFTCEEIWCQLFSEPSAGSDLAGLATRAIRDGEHWVVNGQKVWTSLAHRAQHALLLARTDPSVPKHQGLTTFILDMSSPGVTVRPLRQITGAAEFNEVFLDDVRVPDANRLGGLGEGWRVATTTLTNERVALSGAGNGPSNIGGAQLDKLLELATQRGAWDDPVQSGKVVDLFIESQLIRWTNQRGRAARRISAPGPEGSVTKLVQCQYNRRLQEAFLDLCGSQSVGWHPDDRSAAAASIGYLRAQANTIEGGTTNILRNVIGERVLGLPREPGPPRDQAWKDIPRN